MKKRYIVQFEKKVFDFAIENYYLEKNLLNVFDLFRIPTTMFNITFYIIVKFSFIFFENLIENLITCFKNNVNQYKDIGCACDVFKNT
jgi:hypothetical protein